MVAARFIASTARIIAIALPKKVPTPTPTGNRAEKKDLLVVYLVDCMGVDLPRSAKRSSRNPTCRLASRARCSPA